MENDKLTSSIRTLTVAIWCLAALIALQLLLWGWAMVRSVAWWSANTRQATLPVSSGRTQVDTMGAEDFQALPLEQKIAKASAIAITRFKRDGDSLRPIITEIPKLRPGTRMYYQVGQEFEVGSRRIEPGTDYGDGDVVFFAGNPAEMRESFSYAHDRTGIGDMPLSRFRELAKAAK